MNKGLKVLKQFENEFPNLYKLGETANILEDGIYTSIDIDKNSTNQYNGYFIITNNTIVAVGEERGREGGWLWFAK